MRVEEYKSVLDKMIIPDKVDRDVFEAVVSYDKNIDKVKKYRRIMITCVASAFIISIMSLMVKGTKHILRYFSKTDQNTIQVENARWIQEIAIDSNKIKGVKIDALVDIGELPIHVVTAKEVYFTEEYMQMQKALLGDEYAIDFMDSIQADTTAEMEWLSEYGEGNGYRRKCIQWTLKGITVTDCTATQETAEMQARSFVESMQIPYLELQNIEKKQVRLNKEIEQEMYIVKFVPYVDDNLLFYEQNEMAFMWLKEEIDVYSPDVSVEVYVTDEGVVRVRYNNPLEFTSEIEIEDCLSIDEAKGYLVERIISKADELSTIQLTDGYVRLDDFHVEYQRVQSGDTFTYIPYYVICKKNKWNDKIEYQNYVSVELRK